MTLFARRPDGRIPYRLPIAAAVLISLSIVATLGRAAGRDGPAGTDALESRRRPVRDAASRVPIRDVELAPPPLPAPDLRVTRDPFAFAPPDPAPVPVPIAPPPEVLPDTLPTVVLSLIGVATATRPDGRAERTAIIAGAAGDLYFVREADAVMARYRVDAVLEDRVRLVESATGASLLLTMR